MDSTISRQAAIDAVSRGCQELRGIFAECEKNLNALPSAERRGRWEDVEHAPNGLLYVTCSVCGKRQAVECTNYCGNCGARMEASE